MRKINKFEYSQAKNKISEEEQMHEYQEWQEDYAEMQTEFYEQNF